MRYCPKYAQFIHPDDCNMQDDCWGLPNWDECSKIKWMFESHKREEDVEFQDGFK